MTRHAAISLGALGDFLLTLPLLRELRRTGPVATVARAAYRALLPDWLADSPFLPVDGTVGTRLFTADALLPPPLAEAITAATVHVFAKPDELLRRNLLRHGAGQVVFHDPRPTTPPHIVCRFFATAGIAPPPGWLTSPTMPVDSPGDALWVHAGSGSPAKSLPPAVLVGQARSWLERTGQPVIVSYGEADLALRPPLRAAFAEAAIPYEEVVCPSLAELRAQLACRARLFVGADTGVTHLAAALGKDVTVGYRTTDPAIWQPVGHCRVLVLA